MKYQHRNPVNLQICSQHNTTQHNSRTLHGHLVTPLQHV